VKVRRSPFLKFDNPGVLPEDSALAEIRADALPPVVDLRQSHATGRGRQRDQAHPFPAFDRSRNPADE
jgi:hypothetical protein